MEYSLQVILFTELLSVSAIRPKRAEAFKFNSDSDKPAATFPSGA